MMSPAPQISLSQAGFYDATGARAVDMAAWRSLGDSDGFRLMQRAGRSALHLASSHFSQASALVVLCGAGNNGGDGYVVAELARARGIDVRVWAVGPARSAEAVQAQDRFVHHGGRVESIESFSPDCLGSGALIIDALLGIGLSRAPDASLANAIDVVNAAPNPVLALDVPTGLDADTGAVPGAAIVADMTLSFIVAKPGLVTGRGPAMTGVLECDDLGIPSTAFAAAAPVARAITPTPEDLAVLRRGVDSHKGSHGHVVVIGGNNAMGGAALLCARGALRAGAGLVSVATRAEHVTAAQASVPEAMTRAVSNPAELEPLLARASVIAIGPGLGLDDWATALFSAAADAGLPVVIDADALTLLANGANIVDAGDAVLTPHPAEAGRLLGIGAPDVNVDRLKAAHEMAERYAATVLLKGVGTVVVDRLDDDGGADGILIAGNPGMATGGMGDVLTGIIAALIAQGLPPSAATRLGAWFHASAADHLAQINGVVGYRASELADALPGVRSFAGGSV